MNVRHRKPCWATCKDTLELYTCYSTVEPTGSQPGRAKKSTNGLNSYLLREKKKKKSRYKKMTGNRFALPPPVSLPNISVKTEYEEIVTTILSSPWNKRKKAYHIPNLWTLPCLYNRVGLEFSMKIPIKKLLAWNLFHSY